MNKWIKWISLAVVFVLSIVAVTGVVLAQGPVDEDGDGVCDECGQTIGEGLMRGWHLQDGESRMGYGRHMNNTPFVDENGDGVCDDFVDEDGDGVCDNHGKSFQGRGMAGDETCPNFVDEDGDGVCDDFVDEDGDGVCDNYLNGTGTRTPQRFGGRGAAERGAMGRGAAERGATERGATERGRNN